MTLALVEKILNRSSVRSFSNVPVDSATLAKLLDCAQCAPTSGLMQSWSVLVISDPQLKEKLIHDNPCIGNVDGHNVNMLRAPSPYLVWLADLRRNKILLDRKNSTAGENFCHADFNLKAICDATIAAQTFCLAAESLNIGTCYMGTIREIPWSYWNKEFGVGKYIFPLFGTAIGYRSENGMQPKSFKSRLPQSVVVHYDQYRDVNSIDEYNQLHLKSGSRFSSFEGRLHERANNLSRTKLDISTSLKDAGFTFK